jgi:hypothetical protein
MPSPYAAKPVTAPSDRPASKAEQVDAMLSRQIKLAYHPPQAPPAARACPATRDVIGFQEAVHGRQDEAETTGLVAEIGQDAVQAIELVAFERARSC